jgi:hypothetical protein
MKTTTIKSINGVIKEIISIGDKHFYVVTTKEIVLYNKHNKVKDSWKLTSAPRSKLYITALGWMIVCESTIKTQQYERGHSINFYRNEIVHVVNENLIFCSNTTNDYQKYGIEITNDPKYNDSLNNVVYNNEPFIWKSISTVRQNSTVHDVEVYSDKNKYTKKLHDKIVLGGTYHGILVQDLERSSIKIYSESGLESKKIMNLSNLSKYDKLFGTAPQHKTYVVGYNSKHKSEILVLSYPVRNYNRWGKCFVIFIIIFTIISLLLCL